MVFENVGGLTFDAAFACLGQGGRIAVCGGIASYCNAKPILNSINPMQVRTPLATLTVPPFVVNNALSPPADIHSSTH